MNEYYYESGNFRGWKKFATDYAAKKHFSQNMYGSIKVFRVERNGQKTLVLDQKRT